jgi:hypothetical protein
LPNVPHEPGSFGTVPKEEAPKTKAWWGSMTLDLSAGAARAIGMRSTQKVSMKHC